MIDARWVGERFAADPAFRIPHMPRFPREYIVLPVADGLCVEGAAERQLLRGGAVKTFVPELIALLDGTRTLEAIAAAFPRRPAAHVRDAVTLLYSRGLLENGPLEAPDDDVAAFAGRFVDHTRHHQHRSEAVALLRSATAAIAAPPDIASMLRADLLAAGVGGVTLIRDGAPDGGRFDLTLVVETTAFSAQTLVRPERTGWTLYATIGEAGATIGPLCVPGYSPCYACYAAYYRSFPGSAAGAQAAFWAGAIGANAFNLLSRIALPQLYNRIQRVVRRDGRTHSTREVAPRVPSCERCGCGADVFPHDPAFFAWMLHTMTAMPPRSLLNRRSYQDHFKSGNIQLARTLPGPRPGAVVIDLPAGVHVARPGALEIEALATLLHGAAGYDAVADGYPRRLTPTGGNLASPELMVIARRVSGLPDGCYRYIGARHALERVRAFDPTVARLIGGSDGDAPRAIVVGTGLLDRVFAKYHTFAYRVVNLDAGFCLASLMLGAAAAELGIVERADFDPVHVAELLQLPARTKLRYPTFVVAIGARRAGPAIDAAAEAFERVLHDEADLQRALPPLRLALAALVARWSAVLRERRSIRDFAAEPVPRALLEGIIESALAVAAYYRDIRGRRIALQPVVAVAHDAPGFPAGLYRVCAGGLERSADLPRGGMAALFQQENMTSAAAGIFITADLERVFGARGAGGYREALVAAGVFAAGVVHAATAAALAACPSGGFFEHGLRETRRSDGFRECPLFAVALGHARRGGLG